MHEIQDVFTGQKSAPKQYDVDHFIRMMLKLTKM